MHAGYVNVTIAMIAVLGTKLFNGDFIGDFNNFQYACLILSIVVLAIWKVTSNAQLSYVLVQLVAVIAYIPMFHRVLVSEVQTESNVLWIAILFASLTAIPKVWEGYKKNKDWLSIIYIGRVIPTNIGLVYLVFAKDIGIYPF